MCATELVAKVQDDELARILLGEGIDFLDNLSHLLAGATKANVMRSTGSEPRKVASVEALAMPEGADIKEARSSFELPADALRLGQGIVRNTAIVPRHLGHAGIVTSNHGDLAHRLTPDSGKHGLHPRFGWIRRDIWKLTIIPGQDKSHGTVLDESQSVGRIGIVVERGQGFQIRDIDPLRILSGLQVKELRLIDTLDLIDAIAVTAVVLEFDVFLHRGDCIALLACCHQQW